MSYQWNPTAGYITAWFWDAAVTGLNLCRGILPLRSMRAN
ncbi:MAG: hypothetical protein QOG75_6109 [Mycobacterium sp.]|jgi:biotin transporter BioY|nr:hypothetical protein [Mycobacterium sp.]